MKIESNLIDIPNRRIYPARIIVENGVIASITETQVPLNSYILPGFIDAHVHIESSLLVPSEFARMAVLHGTIATVSDPHEIANVLGMPGVDFMINNGKKVPFHFFFGAPGCVPATSFETAGAELNAEQVDELLARKDIWYLSEMMNFPGVLNGDKEVLKKIAAAQHHHKPIDGHAPGLRGNDIAKYIHAGISTDHECYEISEALEKLALGMKVLIREGSAARNYTELIPLMAKHSAMLMFCSDDKHPDSLLEAHINQLVARSLALGYDLYDVLTVACINPVLHYNLPVGLLKEGDPADFIITKDLKNFTIDQTWIMGNCVMDKGVSLIQTVAVEPLNNFNCGRLEVADIEVAIKELQPVIVCLDGQLVTERVNLPGADVSTENDILKLIVVNRYSPAPVATAFIKNFGLKKGAIASSVAHDSHNIIAVGTTDKDLCAAVNAIITSRGGLSAVVADDNIGHLLPLPVAGLMSDQDAWIVSAAYTSLHRFAIEELGCTLRAPFMSLSFMALLVIPKLKLSDKGLFDGETFSFV